MKIGVIADIHSNGVALDRVLDFFSSRDIHEIYSAGDLVGYNTQPNHVINSFKLNSIESVLGNHDWGVITSTPSDFNYYAKRALDWNRRNIQKENIEFLERLPEEIWLEIEGEEIHIVHGSPKEPLSGYIYEDQVNEGFLEFSYDDPPDILIHGQTHMSYQKRVSDTLVVNPGSVGQPRDGDNRASCAIIDLDNLETSFHRLAYDISKIQREIREHLPIELAERLEIGK